MKTGRVRMSDDSMRRAGIRKGDVVRVELGQQPRQRGLCLAFTAYGELVVRRYHKERNGDIRLTTGPGAKVVQVFAPGAVIIFGRVAGVENGH
jgi:SOS-response transcriptional repressor LexA